MTNRSSVGGRARRAEPRGRQAARAALPPHANSRGDADDYEYLASRGGSRRSRLLHRAASAAWQRRATPFQGRSESSCCRKSTRRRGTYPRSEMVPSKELLSAVQAHLSDRRLVGTSLEVRGASLTWVTVEVRIRLRGRTDLPIGHDGPEIRSGRAVSLPQPLRRRTRRQRLAVRARPLRLRDLRPPPACPGDGVRRGRSGLRRRLGQPRGAADSRRLGSPVPRDGVVCSGRHQVTITREGTILSRGRQQRVGEVRPGASQIPATYRRPRWSDEVCRKLARS